MLPTVSRRRAFWAPFLQLVPLLLPSSATALLGSTDSMPFVRPVLPANTSFYVNSAFGHDTNDGLTPATAWQTLQHAVDTIWDTVDGAGFTPTINIADGYTGVGCSRF